jgi:hypothetical protein
MLDERQQFKAAFMMRCIEQGVTTPEEMTEVVKEAREKLAKDIGVLGLGAAAIAPPALGFMAGNALGRTGDLNDIDAEEVKRKELIDELKKQTAHLRRGKPSAL